MTNSEAPNQAPNELDKIATVTDTSDVPITQTDILKESAKNDPLFDFALSFVDNLPKLYNTVALAQSRIGETVPIEVVGNISSMPQMKPVPRTKSDDENKRSEHLYDKTFVLFGMTYESFTLQCIVHNVTGLGEANGFPYGKDNDTFAEYIRRLQYAYKQGRLVRVLGKYVTYRVGKSGDEQRLLYVDTIIIEDDSVSSKMTEMQFSIFLELCKRNKTTPLDIFMKEIFIKFEADEYLKKLVALFCLSPNSREEMAHILILTAPGEGKDYLIDTVIQPMCKCGKVESDQVTTTAALVGAMSANDLTSLGVGILQRYHHERLAVSEVQTWNSSKFGALLGVMANGCVVISKGQVQDVKRQTCENILMAGNIDNTWSEGMNKWDKLDPIIGGKNKQYAKQLISRFSLIFANPSLLKNPDDFKKFSRMLGNIDNNADIKEGDLFDTDVEIKRICTHTDIDNVEKARLIRHRKVELLRSRAGRQDDEICTMLRFQVFQEFFGQYFKYVSFNLPVKTLPCRDVLIRTMQSMANNNSFGKIMKNEQGNIDPRKFAQFSNICKSFAKINGRLEIGPEDVAEAQKLYIESISTIVDSFGMAIMKSNLDMVELGILQFMSDNGSPVTVDQIRKHIRSEGASDSFFMNNLKHLEPYINCITSNGTTFYFIKYEAIPEDLRTELNIRPANNITEKDALGQVKNMSGEEFDKALEGVEMEEV